ncbi:hypothetical protein NSK_004506 [Nannochloropsis salina CCMP1776]|uniref:Uncharacterized protein n=1 Tax=Nannochloropsis salina CCMP1776 TaxID=1027361 RepID=A0A4D9CYP7_9STRA|nr:hypothetical protein NSK_004506 [Nannochloropsis salina CCMP1776]|eukprot:TFJ84521.1 hypothetical protein NSK_004506 [Nannochloropsis salina CCMP1776]
MNALHVSWCPDAAVPSNLLAVTWPSTLVIYHIELEAPSSASFATSTDGEEGPRPAEASISDDVQAKVLTQIKLGRKPMGLLWHPTAVRPLLCLYDITEITLLQLSRDEREVPPPSSPAASSLSAPVDQGPFHTSSFTPALPGALEAAAWSLHGRHLAVCMEGVLRVYDWPTSSVLDIPGMDVSAFTYVDTPLRKRVRAVRPAGPHSFAATSDTDLSLIDPRAGGAPPPFSQSRSRPSTPRGSPFPPSSPGPARVLPPSCRGSLHVIHAPARPAPRPPGRLNPFSHPVQIDTGALPHIAMPDLLAVRFLGTSSPGESSTHALVAVGSHTSDTITLLRLGGLSSLEASAPSSSAPGIHTLFTLTLPPLTRPKGLALLGSRLLLLTGTREGERVAHIASSFGQFNAHLSIFNLPPSVYHPTHCPSAPRRYRIPFLGTPRPSRPSSPARLRSSDADAGKPRRPVSSLAAVTGRPFPFPCPSPLSHLSSRPFPPPGTPTGSRAPSRMYPVPPVPVIPSHTVPAPTARGTRPGGEAPEHAHALHPSRLPSWTSHTAAPRSPSPSVTSPGNPVGRMGTAAPFGRLWDVPTGSYTDTVGPSRVCDDSVFILAAPAPAALPRGRSPPSSPSSLQASCLARRRVPPCFSSSLVPASSSSSSSSPSPSPSSSPLSMRPQGQAPPHSQPPSPILLPRADFLPLLAHHLLPPSPVPASDPLLRRRARPWHPPPPRQPPVENGARRLFPDATFLPRLHARTRGPTPAFGHLLSSFLYILFSFRATYRQFHPRPPISSSLLASSSSSSSPSSSSSSSPSSSLSPQPIQSSKDSRDASSRATLLSPSKPGPAEHQALGGSSNRPLSRTSPAPCQPQPATSFLSASLPPPPPSANPTTWAATTKPLAAAPTGTGPRHDSVPVATHVSSSDRQGGMGNRGQGEEGAWPSSWKGEASHRHSQSLGGEEGKDAFAAAFAVDDWQAEPSVHIA